MAKQDDKKAPEPEARAPGRRYDGPTLRRIREGKSISLAEISDQTKITKPILAALEAERYAELPNARIYVTGFTRCVAEELGLDPDEVAESYVIGWDQWASA